MASIPDFAIAAPTNPPTIVCEELEGIPNHQVSKFHAIAATNPLPITVKSMTFACTIPLPMVFATCNPKKRKAIKLKNAAHATANFGERTLVETTVAIEFAAS